MRESGWLKRQIKDARGNIRWIRQFGLGGTLLDLGANVGEAAIQVIDQFDRIICVEANPATAETARERIAGYERITLINRVVAPYDNISYYVSNPSPNSLGATARREKRSALREYFEVQSISFRSLLDKYQPRCIKMDIEGSEFDILKDYQLPACVEWLVVEFHGFRPLAKNIAEQFVKQGYKLVNPKALSAVWTLTTLCFHRGGGEDESQADQLHRKGHRRTADRSGEAVSVHKEHPAHAGEGDGAANQREE